MAELLLDVTVFHDYCQGDPDARDIFERIVQGEVSGFVSPLTVCRLWSHRDFDRRTEIAFTGMLSFLQELPLSAGAAKTAGLWIASLDDSEQSEPVYFALVAASASESGKSICTRNPDPFIRFYPEVIEY